MVTALFQCLISMLKTVGINIHLKDDPILHPKCLQCYPCANIYQKQWSAFVCRVKWDWPISSPNDLWARAPCLRTITRILLSYYTLNPKFHLLKEQVQNTGPQDFRPFLLHSAAGASRAYGACTIVIQCNDTKVNRVCTVILWGETPHTPHPFFNLSKISNSYYTVYIFSHCNIALSSNLNWRVINCCCVWRHHFLGTSILDSTPLKLSLSG